MRFIFFCDDALGMNVSVFLKDLGAPFKGKYTLGARFWQGRLWSNDVTSYAWVEHKNELLVTSSGLYGTGSLYLLNLDAQESRVLCQVNSANIEMTKIEGKQVFLKYKNEQGKHQTVQVSM